MTSLCPDTVTILRSRSGVLTKRIAADRRVIGFSAGAWFSVYQRQVPTFTALAALLPQVASDPYACIIRGALLPGVDNARCRRRCDRALHGDAVTFTACPRQWLALDIDDVPEPDCLTFAAEPEAGVEHVLDLLPEPFADASCWWQATSSAGLKPGIRCRLWFRLSRPVSDGEAKGWLACHPVDRSIFTPVAPHYVAPPILAPGVADPVIRRCGVRRGLDDTVVVPDLLPVAEARPADPAVVLSGAEPSADALVALAAAVLASPIVAAIWAGERTYPDRSRAHFALAAALARAGCTDPDTLHRVLALHDRRRGLDTEKILRPDYARRTIHAALAAEGHPS